MKAYPYVHRLFCLVLLMFSLTCLPITESYAKEEIFVYRSPLTAAFFKQNGTDFDTLLGRWHSYLKSSRLNEFREVTRAQLLHGLPPGVLVLGSAVLLDDAEREAITRYTDAGNSVLATWGTGARDGKGHWSGYGFIEQMMNIKVSDLIKRNQDEWFLNLYGDSPLTWAQPAGRRFFLGKTAESPIKFTSQFLSGRYLNWGRAPNAKSPNGAISYFEKGASRRIYLGFSESSWEYISSDELFPVLDSMLDWLLHRPRVFKATWPNGFLSGHLVEMDTEDKYENSIHFAKDLESIGARGTFYSLTSISRKHPELVRRLAEKHEIGYHADVHIGFKGKTEEEQLRRLKNMIQQMKDSVQNPLAAPIVGFRAPTESFDHVTDRLIRQLGLKHHVTDPNSSEARVPFFSRAEQNINPEEAIIALPRTQGDDLNYQALKLPDETIETMMLAEADMIMQMGALGVLSVHSQNYGDGGMMAIAVPPYLKLLVNNKSQAWVATGGEIAEWWRARDRMSIKPAAAEDKSIQISVRAPGKISGATLIVTNPSKDQSLKSLRPLYGKLPEYRIQRIDDFRTAVIFKLLDTGEYRVELQF